VVVESLAEEFDLVEIASAAVKMALALEAGEGSRGEEEIPVVSLKKDGPRPEGRKGPRPAHDARKATTGTPTAGARTSPGTPTTGARTSRLYIAADGRRACARRIWWGDRGRAGVGSHVIGSIEIGDRFSIVEVPTAWRLGSSSPCGHQDPRAKGDRESRSRERK